MLHSWTCHPSTLSCSLCLRIEKNKIYFWFCWCFSQTGPMHLISALSLWAGTLHAKPKGDLQLPDSTKWWSWIYEHKYTGDTRHSGNHCPKMLEDVNYNNNNYYNRPQQNQEPLCPSWYRGGHSWTPRELSSTLVLPRSVSTSRGRIRRFPSRTILHKFQSNPDMNQGIGPTGGTGTSKCGSIQLRW